MDLPWVCPYCDVDISMFTRMNAVISQPYPSYHCTVLQCAAWQLRPDDGRNQLTLNLPNLEILCNEKKHVWIHLPTSWACTRDLPSIYTAPPPPPLSLPLLVHLLLSLLVVFPFVLPFHRQRLGFDAEAIGAAQHAYTPAQPRALYRAIRSRYLAEERAR